MRGSKEHAYFVLDVNLICLFHRPPHFGTHSHEQPQRYVREHACPHRESASKRGSESASKRGSESASKRGSESVRGACVRAHVRERESVLVFFVFSIVFCCISRALHVMVARIQMWGEESRRAGGGAKRSHPDAAFLPVRPHMRWITEHA